MGIETLNIISFIVKDINDFKLETFPNITEIPVGKDNSAIFDVILLLNGLIDNNYNLHIFICSYDDNKDSNNMKYAYMAGSTLEKSDVMINNILKRNFAVEFPTEGFFELRVYLIPKEKDNIQFPDNSLTKQSLTPKQEEEIFTNEHSILKSAILFKLIKK